MSETSVESSRAAASSGRRIMGASSRRVEIAVLVVIAIAVRLNYVLPVLISGVKLSGDALYRYHAIAQNLVSGNGFSSDSAAPFHANNFEQPLYPWFVAAVYWLTSGSQKAVVVVQLGLELLTLVLVVKMSQTLGLSRRVQLAALALGLLSPFLASNGTFLRTEVLDTLVVTFACWMFLKSATEARWAPSVLAGLASGLSLLIRPDLVIAVGLMMTATVLCCWRKGPRRRAVYTSAILAATVVAVLTPWTLRGYLLFGEVRPLGGSARQINIAYANWLSTWIVKPADMREYWWIEEGGLKPAPREKLYDDAEWSRAREAHEIQIKNGTIEGEASEIYAGLAGEALRRRPIRTLVLVPISRLFFDWADMPFSGVGVPQTKPIILLNVLFWWLLTGLVLVGMQRALVLRRRLMLVPVGLLVGRLALPMISALALEPRHLLEAIPVCLMFAGVAVDYLVTSGEGVLGLKRRLRLATA